MRPRTQAAAAALGVVCVLAAGCGEGAAGSGASVEAPAATTPAAQSVTPGSDRTPFPPATTSSPAPSSAASAPATTAASNRAVQVSAGETTVSKPRHHSGRVALTGYGGTMHTFHRLHPSAHRVVDALGDGRATIFELVPSPPVTSYNAESIARSYLPRDAVLAGDAVEQSCEQLVFTSHALARAGLRGVAAVGVELASAGGQAGQYQPARITSIRFTPLGTPTPAAC